MLGNLATSSQKVALNPYRFREKLTWPNFSIWPCQLPLGSLNLGQNDTASDQPRRASEISSALAARRLGESINTRRLREPKCRLPASVARGRANHNLESVFLRDPALLFR